MERERFLVKSGTVRDNCVGWRSVRYEEEICSRSGEPDRRSTGDHFEAFEPSSCARKNFCHQNQNGEHERERVNTDEQGWYCGKVQPKKRMQRWLS